MENTAQINSATNQPINNPEKSITIVQAQSGHGKSQTLRFIRDILVSRYKGIETRLIPEPNTDSDIRVIVKVFQTVIGINSCGDPNYLKYSDLIDLQQRGSEHIICTCRTRGETSNVVAQFANAEDYQQVWTKNYYIEEPTLQDPLNQQRANEIIKMLLALII